MSNTNDDTIDWLIQQSMLEQVRPLAARISGHGAQWQHPYAEAQPRAASAAASVWFTAYPGAIITRDGQSVLATLGDDALWRTLRRHRHPGHPHRPDQAGRRRLPVASSRRPSTATSTASVLAIDPQFGTAGRVSAHERQRRATTAPSSSTTSCPATPAKGPISGWPSAPMATIPASITWSRSHRGLAAAAACVRRAGIRSTCRRTRSMRCTTRATSSASCRGSSSTNRASRRPTGARPTW